MESTQSAPSEVPAGKMPIAALVAGIASVVLGPLGIVAITLGILGLRSAGRRGSAKGKTLSWVGMSLGACGLVFCTCMSILLLPALAKARDTARKVKAEQEARQVEEQAEEERKRSAPRDKVAPPSSTPSTTPPR